MTSTKHKGNVVRDARSAWLLAGSGGLLAAMGGVWWAWDADPAFGKVLLAGGLVIVLAGAALTRWAAAKSNRGVTVMAVLVTMFAAYEMWAAVVTIGSLSGSRNL